MSMEKTDNLKWLFGQTRRINLQLDGCKMGFSVPIDTPREKIVEAAVNMMAATYFGRSRRIVTLDGDYTLLQRLEVVWTYIESYGWQIWHATFGRKAAQRKVDGFRAAIEEQLT
jgi:hypothetical protein